MLSGAADSGVFSTGPTSVMKGYGVHTFAGASCPRRLSAYPSHAQRGRVARRGSGETGGGPLRQRTPPVRLASPIGHPPNEERTAQNGRRLSLPRAAGEGGSPRKRRDGWGPSPATHPTRPLGFANRPPSPLKRGGIGASRSMWRLSMIVGTSACCGNLQSPEPLLAPNGHDALASLGVNG